ncbi:abortive infection system antitoxin AbiGi family protein [Aeromonas caviae]|jgi:hypothetical protein
MDRPDFSNYLGHFTTGRQPFSKAQNNPTIEFKGVKPIDRLENILKTKKILASRLPWNNKDAVCLTECPWGSLLAHAKTYSPYGVGFTKEFVFSKSGGPAFYVRADVYDKQTWEDSVHRFVTPFWPSYRPADLKNYGRMRDRDIDYSHEREWRVPCDLEFEYEDIAFVVLKDYRDMAKFPKSLKDNIGRHKFLLMENYQNIEKLWPLVKVET